MVAPLKPYRTHNGFTLSEILIAIAVVTVLAFMTVSAVTATQRKTQQVSCTSHLRAIGVATLAYAQDHAGLLPGPIPSMQRPTTRLTSDPSALPDFLARYLGIENLTTTSIVVPQFICPAAKKIMDSQSSTPTAPSCYVASGVLVNGEATGSPFGYRASGATPRAPQTLSSLHYPASTPLLIDLDGALFAERGIAVPSSPALPAHGTTRNILFADGHVEAISVGRFHWQIGKTTSLEIR